MSLLLPQTRVGTVRSARPVNIHGDRYVDLAIALEGDAGPPVVGGWVPARLKPSSRCRS